MFHVPIISQHVDGNNDAAQVASGSERDLRKWYQEDDVKEHVEAGDDGHADQCVGGGEFPGPRLEHGDGHQGCEHAESGRQEADIGHDEGAGQHQHHQPDAPDGRSRLSGRVLVQMRFEQIPHDEADAQDDHDDADRHREDVGIVIKQRPCVVQEDAADQDEDAGQDDAWSVGLMFFCSHFTIPYSVSSAGQ